MSVDFWSETLEVVGTLLIAWAALRAHHRVLYEHTITPRVLHLMRIEQKFGLLGMALLLAGYALHVLY